MKLLILRHPKVDFDNIVYKEFEGHQIPVMTGYDRYLKLIWGDYMKFPPVSERVAKHDTVFIDMNNSYRAYKGRYYCIKKEKQ